MDCCIPSCFASCEANVAEVEPEKRSELAIRAANNPDLRDKG
jgi:hypothetical protein